MNILLLFSGSDTSFRESGYEYPKNLIEINGKPLLQNVLESLDSNILKNNKLIFAIKKEEIDRYHTSMVAKLLYPKATIISVPNATAGAVCTALLAVEYIDNDEPLLIVNGDIIIQRPLEPIIASFKNSDADGGAITFQSVHPRWSYVKCDETGIIIEAAEKRPISRMATAGIYYYKRGDDFVSASKELIKKNAQTDGKFYICPVFNEMILKQKKLRIFEIESKCYFSLATPKGIESYQKAIAPERNTVI